MGKTMVRCDALPLARSFSTSHTVAYRVEVIRDGAARYAGMLSYGVLPVTMQRNEDPQQGWLRMQWDPLLRMHRLADAVRESRDVALEEMLNRFGHGVRADECTIEWPAGETYGVPVMGPAMGVTSGE